MPDFVFGTRLKMLRESKGLLQKDLAKISGISANNISNWELGFGRPSVDKLRILCRALNCSADVLLGMTQYRLTEDELTCLLAYRELDETGKQLVRAVLHIQNNSGNPGD